MRTCPVCGIRLDLTEAECPICAQIRDQQEAAFGVGALQIEATPSEPVAAGAVPAINRHEEAANNPVPYVSNSNEREPPTNYNTAPVYQSDRTKKLSALVWTGIALAAAAVILISLLILKFRH